MVPVHTSVARQQRPQPQSVWPRLQRAGQVPDTHTWPQGQPVGHEAGAHWNCSGVAGFELRLHVLPEGHVPAQ